MNRKLRLVFGICLVLLMAVWLFGRERLSPRSPLEDGQSGVIDDLILRVKSAGWDQMSGADPEFLSDRLEAFFLTVGRGQSSTPSIAAEGYLIEGAQAPVNQRTLSVGTIWLIILLALGLGTLLSEDLTCIAAGLLVARGVIPVSFAMFACFLGIWIGDMLLYAIGRYGGGCLLSRWPFRYVVSAATIESARLWLNRRGGTTVLISRFMPGTRLPLYLAAGLVKVNVFKMMIWFALAGALWAFPVVALVAYFGHSASAWLTANGVSMLLGLICLGLISLLLIRFILASLTHEGRRKLFVRVQRILRWEFWPPYLFYIPVVVALIGTVLRKGKPLAFTSCNPGMPHSGIVGESKTQILDQLCASGCVAKYMLIRADAPEKKRSVCQWMAAEQLSFPLVIKPDQGERGTGVCILNHELELEAELQQRDCDTLVQAYVSGLEFGVLYVRYPDQMNGSIVSLTRKRMTSVIGDGQRTLKQLILDDPRAVLSYQYFFEKLQDQLADIPAAGQRVTLAAIGSHCRGALFLNGADLITPQLEAEVDRIAKTFEGFYLGRFDIRCPSESDLRQGVDLSVIELNGVTSEPTHIYHPHTPIRIGLKSVVQHWQRAYEIGLVNSQRGASMSSLREIIALLKNT